MFVVTDAIRIPDEEFTWSFVRSGGPGGQNVNKVASKAVLRWPLATSPSVPEPIKSRLRLRLGRRVTTEGDVVITSTRYRDQERNRQDCLDKLLGWFREVLTPPKPRKATKPSRASKERRLAEKAHRARRKQGRRDTGDG